MLERNVLDENEVYQIMKQCLSALNYLSHSQICHRDIKLENLMLQNVNDISNIKLIDFGLSKDIQQRGMIKSLCSGSPFYIAPEVISCRLSLACDMWSLGVVMYVALSGKLPFPGESTQEIFENVIQKNLDIEGDMDLNHVSPEGRHLLTMIMNKDP